jgi:prepilin-type N-terminal cleavage/methylation domain-containing protein
MKRGFTLIELLVVMAIISMLAGQIMPSLSAAREQARMVNCVSQFHQIGVSIEIYYQDYDDYPTWLSTLVPSYLPNEKIFVCLTDKTKGVTGHGNPQYPGCNDIPPAQIAGYSAPYDAGFDLRNPGVTTCSYSYEFSPCTCEWFMEGLSGGTFTDTDRQNADIDRNGVVTWKEAKLWQAKSQGYNDVPIIRCFWHMYNQNRKVINMSYKDYHVFQSRSRWEGTSD